MKRLNNKGFMFAETLVVTTILMVSIMSIYVVFSNLYNNYKARTKYENVEALYAANNIKRMIGQNGINVLGENIPELGFIDFSLCPEYTLYYNSNYCSKIIAYSDIKTALFTNYDMKIGDSEVVIDTSSFDREFQDYIKYLNKIKVDMVDDSLYRIIIELNNGNFSNIVVESTT